MHKSLRGKGLLASKQEGSCPHSVLKITSRETFCKVRGNSPSTLTYHLSFSGKVTILTTFCAWELDHWEGAQSWETRFSHETRSDFILHCLQVLQSTPLHRGNTLSKSSWLFINYIATWREKSYSMPLLTPAFHKVSHKI